MPSPNCTVQDGAGTPQVTPPFATVTPGNTVTIALASAAGVDAWAIECTSADETTAPASIALTVDALNKTATFTAPAVGKALIFRSRINNGKDGNDVSQASYTTTFKVVTLTSEGYAVGAVGEELEHNGTYGWLSILNQFLRDPPSGAPSGAAGGDLTGTYPSPTLVAAGTPGRYGTATQVPQITTDPQGRVTEVTEVTVAGVAPGGAAGGSLGGTYPNPTVLQLDGASGVATVTASEVRWGAAGRGTRSIEASTTTTTNAANQTLATISVPADTTYDLYVHASARDTAASGGYRGEWSADIFSRRTGTNSGNLERQGSTPTVTTPKPWGTLASASFDVAISGNDILVRGSPGATANVKWNLEIALLVNA